MLHTKGQMQRDPSEMDRARPMSPGSGDNAPSPSKRPRLDSMPFNPNQAALMQNGRPVAQGIPGQQQGAIVIHPQLHQMLLANGLNPATLSSEQLQHISNQSPAAQAKSIQAYSQNLQQHHNSQLPNKVMPNMPGPPGQGSPMIPQGPDGVTLNAFYNASELAGPATMRPGPGAPSAGGGSNHALQDYQMQLMLLEQQNKKRLMMARQEQDGIVGMGRPDGTPGVTVGTPGAPGQPGGPGGPGVPGAPNAGQSFQGSSPQGGRPGTSPNTADQMKRNNQQMTGNGMGSPLPENHQPRGSPINTVNFMGAHMDPSMAPNFYKVDNLGVQQMNGMRNPGAPPNIQFNGPMGQQMMAAARQQQAAVAAGPAGQGGPPIQWQPSAPNGGLMNGQQGQPISQTQGTPQPRAMAPPSAPGAAATNANHRTTASPQTSSAAPPTPQTAAKGNPKKKDGKNTKKVRMRISHLIY